MLTFFKITEYEVENLTDLILKSDQVKSSFYLTKKN